MIEKLGYNEACIFDVSLADSRKYLVITEACNGFYDVFLTKAQVIELANDFLRIADKMD